MQSPLKIQGTAKMWRTNCPGRARHGHRLRATPKTRHRDTGSERLAGGRPGRAPGTRTGHTDAGPGARGRRRRAALAVPKTENHFLAKLHHVRTGCPPRPWARNRHDGAGRGLPQPAMSSEAEP